MHDANRSKMSHEKLVIRRPVKPKDAVQAGIIHAKTLMTTMIAKLDQKSRPMLGPTIPVLTVATAMFALSLQNISRMSRILVLGAYQNVHAFQTFWVFCFRSSSVMRWIPPVSTDKAFAHLRKRPCASA